MAHSVIDFIQCTRSKVEKEVFIVAMEHKIKNKNLNNYTANLLDTYLAYLLRVILTYFLGTSIFSVDFVVLLFKMLKPHSV